MRRPPRSALPIPRYVLPKRLASGLIGYFFNPPTWATAKAGCPVAREALGTDYAAARDRAETVLLPALDAWRNGGAPAVSAVARPGTLDWLFGEYRASRQFTKLDPMTRTKHEAGFRLVGGYVLQNGARLGASWLTTINAAIADDLYAKLLINESGRERRTTVNHAMKTCRRAWNVAMRRNPGKVPAVNPFAGMGLEPKESEGTPTATFSELQAFRAKAIEMGHPSLATAALIGWEWLQREKDIFATFDAAHYRPKDQPHAVRIRHRKTKEENWVPLFDDDGAALYPELMAELDALKRERISGLMIRRDWGTREPWPTYPSEGVVDLRHMRWTVRRIILAAGLRRELSFRSFRHGGFTEAGDAELTDRQIMAQGRHRSPNVLARYVKRTMRQVAEGTKKRRAARTGVLNLSE